MSFNIARDGRTTNSATGAGSSRTKFDHPPASRPSTGLLPYGSPSSRLGTTIGQLRPSPADHSNSEVPSVRSTNSQSERVYGSPRRKRQRIDADRFIPARSGRDLQSGFHLIPPPPRPTPEKGRPRSPPRGYRSQKSEEADETFRELLRAELFDDASIPQASPRWAGDERMRTPPRNTASLPATPQKNLFSYVSPRHQHLIGLSTPRKTPQRGHNLIPDPRLDTYSTTPISYSSQQMLLAPRRQHRTVAKVPIKVLDAPNLAEDFYLNLMDWGSSDVLAVGLGTGVFMYNAQNGKVAKLCTLEDDKVTSVSWIQKGTHIAVGTKKGLVQIWDAQKFKRLRTMTGHTARVGSLAWNAHILSTGSRDRTILHRDVRAPDQWVKQLTGHKQEVCGLKWNCQDGQLASGSNDNTVLVWDKAMDQKPLWLFNEHIAAVKALAWSPHQRGLLASGGGTADRRIIFHDTVRGTVRNDIDTGSQVCNLMWSKNSNELVSTHGYIQNNLVIWKYPSMTRVASLTGHTYRVLYLAMSPDGTQVVTGAGDETLRFWEVFKPKQPVRLLGNSIDLPVIR
ncbi:quinon protein alcohol dehydrogenase-like superfamily [Corynascus novoguineensis]|uniref:Quinon protein alcohol dehydrogenase-like superfamily n=1 Tax=Corynascus novoguineensis TaxID=1126955 RepID=A0AAN7CYA5_9PEZI|nr:quinon protein alcohol dehydrogenase-like superfamily [Corynascus novoguineensis]